MADALRQSDLQICQTVAAALEGSATRAYLARMCVDLPTPTIMPDENDFAYVKYQTNLGRTLRQGAVCLACHHPAFGRMPDTIVNRMAACEIFGRLARSNMIKSAPACEW